MRSFDTNVVVQRAAVLALTALLAATACSPQKAAGAAFGTGFALAAAAVNRPALGCALIAAERAVSRGPRVRGPAPRGERAGCRVRRSSARRGRGRARLSARRLGAVTRPVSARFARGALAVLGAACSWITERDCRFSSTERRPVRES